MICYSDDNNNLVFATVQPGKKKRDFFKAIDVVRTNEDYFEVLDVTAYEELKENMEPSILHEKYQECFLKGNYYSFKNSKIDFKNRIGYSEDFNKEDNTGLVKEFYLKRPIITEFCLKGNFNSFANGRKVSSNDDCNLFKLIDQDKEALKEIKHIIKSEEREIAESIIMSQYPEFAEFYFNVMPNITIEEQSVLSIRTLNQAGKFDQNAREMLEMLPIAQDNACILKLLPKKK